MGRIELHPDFKDVLRLLNSHGVEYLVVGGYAVGYYGYPRATGDMDIWIAVSEANAERTAQGLREFGMPEQETVKGLFTQENKIIRMGVPPVRIEVITGASGVRFDECYSRRNAIDMDGVWVNFISLADLKTNKRACGRHKDLEDLERLP
jgi:predicted nucleotidyltransferase